MKSLKRLLSLLLAVSALCILFAFQASALTTNCPDCGRNVFYYGLGDVGIGNPAYHHEVHCSNCGWSTEEDCDMSEDNDSTHTCTACGFTASHTYSSWDDRGSQHVGYCVSCGHEHFESHNFVNGFCTECGIPAAK